MRYHKGTKNKSRAFTLIELLVVISIIALLVSILMPALGKAKSQARKVVCSSNLHQYGIGLYSYTTDTGKIMSTVTSGGNVWPDGIRWLKDNTGEFNMEAIGPYTTAYNFKGSPATGDLYVQLTNLAYCSETRSNMDAWWGPFSASGMSNGDYMYFGHVKKWQANVMNNGANKLTDKIYSSSRLLMSDNLT